MLTQRGWRVLGLITLTGAGAMAIGGMWVRAADSRIVFAVYWTVFTGLIVITLYTVLLDLRYIRLLYTSGKRDIFNETLGSEEFRRSLHEGTVKNRKSPPDSTPPVS